MEFGLTEMEAICAATGNAAEALDLDDRLGTLQQGKLADIISIMGDPLQDIGAIGEVGLVMKGGKRYDELSLN